MAKEKPADPDKGAKKLAKAEKKAKRAETDGVRKTKSDKKEKKDRKEKKEKTIEPISPAADVEVTTKLFNTVEGAKPGSVAVKEEGDIEVKIKKETLLAALVPFANPLADEKVGKKVLKSVKKGNCTIYSFTCTID